MPISKLTLILFRAFELMMLALSLLTGGGMQAQTSPFTVRQLFTFSCVTTGTPPHPVTVSCPMGSQPSPLIQSSDGNFYGATSFGGTGNKAAGTIFRLTSSGQLTTLYTFVANQKGNYPNGANPGGVVEGNDGFLYGSTVTGVANNTGVVFKLSKTGAFHVVHVGGVGGLTLGVDGNLGVATVPAGATTGPIEVTNAGGTSPSAEIFVVQ